MEGGGTDQADEFDLDSEVLDLLARVELNRDLWTQSPSVQVPPPSPITGSHLAGYCIIACEYI